MESWLHCYLASIVLGIPPTKVETSEAKAYTTRMNKTDVLVIDIGTMRRGHHHGIFSEWRCTYSITDHCLAVGNVALSRMVCM